MEHIVGPLFYAVILGAALSWFGRTWPAQIIAWAVVGFVGGLTIYYGIEVHRMLIDANSAAEELNSPILQFALHLVDLKPIATALSTLNEGQRDAILFVIVVAVLVSLTLPFIVFANGIWASIQSGEGAKTAATSRSEINSKMSEISRSNQTLERSVQALSEMVEEQRGEIRRLSESIDSESARRGAGQSLDGDSFPETTSGEQDDAPKP